MVNDRIIRQPLFLKQEFLSSDGSSVSAKCEINQYFSDDEKTKLNWVDLDCDLTLSNGDKVLEVYLESYNGEARQESIERLGKLIMIMEQLKAAMIYADEQIVELDKIVEANNKVNEEVVHPIV